ncbi:MAG: hypothetical protein R2812_06705 [Gelidibacter sp.]
MYPPQEIVCSADAVLLQSSSCCPSSNCLCVATSSSGSIGVSNGYRTTGITSVAVPVATGSVDSLHSTVVFAGAEMKVLLCPPQK